MDNAEHDAHHHTHHHHHETDHVHPPAPPPPSLMRMSLTGRITIAVAASLTIWLAVFWAMRPQL